MTRSPFRAIGTSGRETIDLARPVPPAVNAPTDADAAALRQSIMGFRMTQMIHAAAKLGVADLMLEAPKSAQVLARAVGAHPGSLARLLRALASVGIFCENDYGEFGLTPRARLLCTDTPGSLRSLALLYGEDWLWSAYGNTLHAVRSGAPGFDHAHGQAFYPYLEAHPEASAAFDAAMSGYSALEAQAILDAYDFSTVPAVLDVGGGHGKLALTLLEAHPRLRATVFDQPATIEQARRVVAKAGLSRRCMCVAGDFFVELPATDGVILLKSVLHNWDDARVLSILGNCRKAMRADSRLLIGERVVAPGNAPSEAKLFDINMLVIVGGQERTEAQYRVLLSEAGFHSTRVVATTSSISLIEARP